MLEKWSQAWCAVADVLSELRGGGGGWWGWGGVVGRRLMLDCIPISVETCKLWNLWLSVLPRLAKQPEQWSEILRHHSSLLTLCDATRQGHSARKIHVHCFACLIYLPLLCIDHCCDISTGCFQKYALPLVSNQHIWETIWETFNFHCFVFFVLPVHVIMVSLCCERIQLALPSRHHVGLWVWFPHWSFHFVGVNNIRHVCIDLFSY